MDISALRDQAETLVRLLEEQHSPAWRMRLVACLDSIESLRGSYAPHTPSEAPPPPIADVQELPSIWDSPPPASPEGPTRWECLVSMAEPGYAAIETYECGRLGPGGPLLWRLSSRRLVAWPPAVKARVEP